jgi:lipopolysaccharide transport system ATP-binding protein
VVNYYLNNMHAKGAGDIPLAERTDRSGNGRIRLTSFHLEDNAGNRVQAVSSAMDVNFVFGYQVCHSRSPRNVDIGLSVSSNNNELLFVLYSSYTGELLETSGESGTFRCRIERLPLSAGQYHIGARVTVGGEEADWIRNDVGLMEVETGDYYGSGSAGFSSATPFLVNGRWSEHGETVFA